MEKRHRRELSKRVLLSHASFCFGYSTLVVNPPNPGALRAVERSGVAPEAPHRVAEPPEGLAIGLPYPFLALVGGDKILPNRRSNSSLSSKGSRLA